MSSVKTQIDGVIEQYGSNVTLRQIAYTGTTDQWGEYDTGASTDQTIKAVKDSNLISQFTLTSAGRVADASSVLIIRGDVVVNAKDYKIVMDGQTYNIMQQQPLEMSGEVLAQLLEIGIDSSN